ncbi:MAG: hypothetical protein EA374_08400 [Acholeplasmatales bacterium]|nr:MAG: hypothetical protein EA374_08400 [Acholeplasmatales bacterium]
MKKLMIVFLFAFMVMGFAACGEKDADPEVYTVTFDTSGGTEIASQTVASGALVSEPAAPVREGFIFTGIWNDSDTPWDFATDVVTADVTLVAHWIGEDEEVAVESVEVSVAGFTLPEANNADERFEVELLTSLTFVLDFLPAYATEQGYTITTSNTRAEVDGNTVNFVYGIGGLGNVSVFIDFEDAGQERLEYRFRTIARPAVENPITHVLITAGDFDLPAPNNAEERPRVALGTTFTLEIDYLPEDATNPNYTVTSSNTRAVVEGHTVTFVEGETGNGNVSIRVFFEDSAVGNFGMVEYRFETFEEEDLDVEIDSVTVTAGEFELPEANNADERPEVEIGTTITLDVAILPEDASNQSYTITTTNSRAVVDGHTVTFVFGATGPGNVSVRIQFEDPSVGVNGLLEYRFLTVEGEEPEINIDSVVVTSLELDMPNVNDAGDRPPVDIGTVITLVIDILPENASNQNYTITSSNSRAVVDGHTVTFVFGAGGPGNVSIRINFADTSVGNNGLLEYRFLTVEAETE